MLLIKNGNLHLPGQIVRKGDILVEDGFISKIGNELAVEGIPVLDAEGKEVFPGFILPVTSVGLTDYANLRQGDSNEISSPCNPKLHVRYALDGREVQLQRYWLSGITSIGAAPADGPLLAGQMGVYHVAGMTAAQMCVCDTVALKGNFTSNVKTTFGPKNIAPMTRMGMASCLRETLRAAKEWMEKEDAPLNSDYEVLAKVLKREIPLLMNVTTVADISDVLALAKEFQIRVILNGAYEADRVTEMIANSGASVIMGDLFDAGARFWYGTDVDKILSLREQLPLCIGCSSGGVGRENLLWNACRLVQMGYEPADVLDLMTVRTAEVLGVDHLIGSIKEGLLGDLVIYNGNPLESWEADVAATVVAGNIVYNKKGEAVC